MSKTTKASSTTTPNSITVELPKDKDCQGSVRFGLKSDTLAVTNIYVSRSFKAIGTAKRVRVTVEVIE
jgi:hypothetical protein